MVCYICGKGACLVFTGLLVSPMLAVDDFDGGVDKQQVPRGKEGKVEYVSIYTKEKRKGWAGGGGGMETGVFVYLTRSRR